MHIVIEFILGCVVGNKDKKYFSNRISSTALLKNGMCLYKQLVIYSVIFADV